MNEIVLELISQFGISGVILALVGYIAYDRYKSNQRKNAGEDGASKNYRAIDELNGKVVGFDAAIQHLNQKIGGLTTQREKEKLEIDARMDKIEETLEEIRNPNNEEIEHQRLDMLTKKYPLIHKILGTSMDSIKCDHIVIGHLHNGTQGLTGIPFIKCSVVAERYNPATNVNDVELASRYQNEDLMRHNLLPSALMQNKYLYFNLLDDNCTLRTVDGIFYNRCKKDGIAELAFHTIQSSTGKNIGFIACYSFKANQMIPDQIKESAALIEEVYNQGN